MFTALRKFFGGVSAGTKPVRAHKRHGVQLTVESLDQRLVPSTVPNLTGVTLDFDASHANSHFLRVTSETDLGNGTATFTGYFQDSAHSVGTNVSGSIWLKASWAALRDFGVSYSGRVDYIPGAWYDGVIGWGDLLTNTISSNPSVYQPQPTNTTWEFIGNDYDYYQINFWIIHQSYGGYNSDSAVSWVVPYQVIDSGTNLVPAYN
jgi:hypothetical protein